MQLQNEQSVWIRYISYFVNSIFVNVKAENNA